MKQKKFFLMFAVLGIAALSLYKYTQAAPGASVANATNVDYLQLDRNGIYDSSGTQRIAVGADNTITGTLAVTGVQTNTSNTIISAPSDVYYGSAASAVSTTTTSGSSQGTIFTAFLASGSANVAAVEGSAICSTTSQQGNQVTAVVCGAGGAINNQKSFIGFAVAAASTGTVVNIYDRGWVLALTTGTVNPGDQLITSANAVGYVETATTVASTSTVAIALGSGLSSGSSTKVRIVR